MRPRARGAPGLVERPRIVGIGEVLWDCLPGGNRLGGAPANFVYHAGKLGAEAVLVSAVGSDAAGDRLAAALEEHGLELAHVQRDPAHATGAVKITLREGQPSYEIAADAAWDHIAWRPDLAALAGGCDAVCFGALGQRSLVSRATIRRFVEATRPDAVRVFDVNLRQNFYDREVLEWGLRHATLLKLNGEELEVLGGMFEGDLLERFSLDLIALTLGADGCELRTREETVRLPAPRIELVDAVGAGDAFAAALIVSRLRGESLREGAERSVRLGANVASCEGAMPVISC